MKAKTLNQILKSINHSTRPRKAPGFKDILDPNGICVFSGDATDVWNWLRREYPAEVRLFTHPYRSRNMDFS